MKFKRSAGVVQLLWVVVATLITPSVCEIKIGGAIDVFRFFGDLSVVMRVVPRHDTGWFFREDTFDIFSEVTELRSLPRKKGNRTFNGGFSLEFCDNLNELLAAYFRAFTVEGSERPWRAFTGGLTSVSLAKKLGLNTTYVTGHYSYVLLRISRNRELVRLADKLKLRPTNQTAESVERVQPGDVESVMRFIRTTGSHYVSSYATGNSLYQVLVYSQGVYEQMKNDFMRDDESSLRLNKVSNYFSPWYAEHIGRIVAASGNGTLEKWAEANLRSKMYIFVYANLLNLRRSPELLHRLHVIMQNEALLQLDLKMLAPLFKDPEKRKWFEEIVYNHLRLWEINV